MNQSTLPLFHFLFCELIEQCYRIHKQQNYIEALKKCGADVGIRLYNLICTKKQLTQRPNSITSLIKNIKTYVFKYLFEYQASNMYTGASEQTIDAPKQYFHILQDNISVYLTWMPQNLWDTSSFVAGIIQGICQSSGLDCKVSSYCKMEAGDNVFTQFQVKISEGEMQRWKQFQQ